MKPALVDTNIFLDVLLDREGLVEESLRVLEIFERAPGAGWISWHTLSNLYYIGERSVGRTAALRQIDAILRVFEVCPVDSAAARLARTLPMKDFEDALQVASALKAGVPVLVTRKAGDFKTSPVLALRPAEFLSSLDA